MSRDALVRLEMDRALAARTTNGGVEVVDFSSDGASWTAEVTAGGTSDPDGESVHITSGLAADPTNEWHTIVYGTAGPGVSRVVLENHEGTGGQVVDGAWVIASTARDVLIGQIGWQFVDAVGDVVMSGEGPFPPAP